MPKSTLDAYLDEIALSLKFAEENIKAAETEIREAHERGSRIWVLGNGGSLAVAQHFAQDLLKVHRISAQCLNDPSVITAFTNDDGFANCFYKPLVTLSQNEDVVVAFSCSGKSKNYKGVFDPMDDLLPRIKRIAIVGTGGGFMKDSADVSIHVKSDNYIVCEAAFGIVADLINKGLGT